MQHVEIRHAASLQRRVDSSTVQETEVSVSADDYRGFKLHIAAGSSDAGHLSWAVADTQGRRPEHEDAHCIVLDLEGRKDPANATALFGVFDGHGGREVAAFCAQHLPAQLLRTKGYSAGNLPAALHEAFQTVDAMLVDPAHRMELFALSTQDPTVRLPEPPKPSQAAAMMAARGAAEPAGPTPGLNPSAAATEDALLKESPPGSGRQPQAAAGRLQVSAPAAAAAGINVAPRDPAMQARAQQVAAMVTGEMQQAAQQYGLVDKGTHNYVGPSSGSTAVVACVRGSDLVVASVGDSRCVFSRGGQAVVLTKDHKPDQPQEEKRIVTAGHFVGPSRRGGIPRVGGNLAMSRAMGDVKFKGNPHLPPEEQAVTAEPHMKEMPVTDHGDFMVLACDGLWDIMQPQQAVDFVAQRLGKQAVADVARELVEDALKRGSTDNITAMVVVFQGNLTPHGRS